jgi:hypothetical protein
MWEAFAGVRMSVTSLSFRPHDSSQPTSIVTTSGSITPMALDLPNSDAQLEFRGARQGQPTQLEGVANYGRRNGT